MVKLPWAMVVLLGWVVMIIATYGLFAALSLLLPQVDLDSDMAMTLLIPVALTGVIAIVITIVRKWPTLAGSHPRLCLWGLLLGPILFLLASNFVVWR